jgi:hypothetical protein
MTENIKIFMAMALVLVIASCGNKSSKSDNSYDTKESTIEVNVLNDGANAKYDRVDNVHQVRFVEIFLVDRDASTGDFVAAVYNTMYTPQGIPESKDTSPQALLEGIDFDQVQKQYGVLGASLNGPKLCLPDWVEIDVGAERDFDGLAAMWCAQLNMGNNASVGEIATYKPVTIARTVGWVGTRERPWFSWTMLMATPGS